MSVQCSPQVDFKLRTEGLHGYHVQGVHLRDMVMEGGGFNVQCAYISGELCLGVPGCLAPHEEEQLWPLRDDVLYSRNFWQLWPGNKYIFLFCFLFCK